MKQRKWSIVHIIADKVYLAIPKNKEAEQYATSYLGKFDKAGNAFVIPEAKMSKHFTLIDDGRVAT